MIFQKLQVCMSSLYVRQCWPRNIKGLSCKIRGLFFSCCSSLNLLQNSKITASEIILWQIHRVSKVFLAVMISSVVPKAIMYLQQSSHLIQRKIVLLDSFIVISSQLLKEAFIPTEFQLLPLFGIFFYKNTSSSFSLQVCHSDFK